ncbi:MAG: hypothetical protein JWN40_2192 [Phycisphaerales bacterium]|nr:hypothetical protein [Phycisphaerales bacterium]
MSRFQVRPISEALEARRFLSAAPERTVVDAADSQAREPVMYVIASARDHERADDVPDAQPNVERGGETTVSPEDEAVSSAEKPDQDLPASTASTLVVQSDRPHPTDPKASSSQHRILDTPTQIDQFVNRDGAPAKAILSSHWGKNIGELAPPLALSSQQSLVRDGSTAEAVPQISTATGDVFADSARAIVRVVTEMVSHPENAGAIVQAAAPILLDLGRTDAIASFADAIAAFAHESAAVGTVVPSVRGHAGAWAASIAIVGIDAVVICHARRSRRSFARLAVSADRARHPTT